MDRWLHPKGRLDLAIRGEPIAHRSAIVAVDKCPTITITAADQAGVVGVMAAAEHKVSVSPGNEFGPVGASVIVAVTPTVNKTVDVTIPQSVGATYYDVFFSIDAAPKWVGRVTEAQRAAGAAITAVGTVGAGGAAGVVNVRLVGTGLQTTNAIFAANNAYTPATVAAALGTTAVPCAGFPKVYVDIELTVTHLGLVAPALTIIPFIKTGTKWYAGEAKALTLLTTAGNPLLQSYSVDVGGADQCVVLVGNIAGTGASAAITCTPGV